MKIRNGFVTNSSSSSFIIAKKHLTEKQVQAIVKHRELGEKLHLQYPEDYWDIEQDDDFITGYTSMDNFDMQEFLEIINVPMGKVNWSDVPFYLDGLPPHITIGKTENKNVLSDEELEEYLNELEED